MCCTPIPTDTPTATATLEEIAVAAVGAGLVGSFQVVNPSRGARLSNSMVDVSWQAAGYPHVAIYDIVWKDILQETIYHGGTSVPATQTSVTIDTRLPSFEKNEICFRLQVLAYDSSGKLLGYVGDLSNERFCVRQP